MLASDAESYGLAVLTRLAKRRPAGEVLLDRVLAGHLPVLLEKVIQTVIETGDPLGKIFARRLAHEGESDLCERVLALLIAPSISQSVPLQEVALTAGEKLLAAYRARWPEPDRDQRARLALLCQQLSTYQINAGRLEEAHEAALEAAGLFFDLSQEDPAEHLQGYTRSLLNLAMARRELGQPHEAAIAAREALKLGEQLPGDQRGLLAASHQLLGGALFDLARTREAEEHNARSISMFSALIEEGQAYFQRALALGLGSEAILLWELGRETEARELAKETADIYLALAAVRPDIFMLDHARSLAFLGVLDRELERYEDAIDAFSGAAKALLQLSEERPEGFRYELSMVLSTLAVLLRETGHPQAALGPTEMAIDNLRKLAEAVPERFIPDLAASLMSQSNNLIDLGRMEEALSLSEEALTLLRSHAAGTATAPSPDLARALLLRARQLVLLGSMQESLPLLQEAAELFRRLAAQEPEPFRHELSGTLTELASSCEALGLAADAADAKRELASLLLRRAE
jgi:hypothetical protein